MNNNCNDTNKRASLAELAVALSGPQGSILCTLIEAHPPFDRQLGAYALYSEGEEGLRGGFGDPALDAAAVSAAKEAADARGSILAHISNRGGCASQARAMQVSILAEYFDGGAGPGRAYRRAAECLARGDRVLFVKELNARAGQVRVQTALFGELGKRHIDEGFQNRNMDEEVQDMNVDGKFQNEISASPVQPASVQPASSPAFSNFLNAPFGMADVDAFFTALATGRFQYNEEKRMLIDPVFPEERLLILGGSGLDSAISELAARAGFSVTLAAEPDRFPQAIQEFHFDAASYILVASRSYYDDYACLQALAGRAFRYAGCLGSARKSRLLFEELRHAGWTEDMLARLHAPVGLPIGAFSPEELAVSIVAELIAVRRGALLPRRE
jgi:hypothetical protein